MKAPGTVTAGMVFVATIALTLSGCGSSTKSTGTAASTAPTPSSTSAASAGTPVVVTEKEFSISLSTTTFNAGTYTFTVKNEGSFPHNLTVNGPGVNAAATQNLSGGQTGTLTVTFQRGSYELFCSVPGHKDRGMDLTVQVN